MNLLRLKCPRCSRALSVDPAFAGSVCRCQQCGTLISVPGDDSAGASRKAERQEEPSAEPSPMSPPPTRPATGRLARPSRPGRPARLLTPVEVEDTEDKWAINEPPPPQKPVVQTISPTQRRAARKSLAVQLTTAVGFLAVLAGLITVSFFGIRAAVRHDVIPAGMTRGGAASASLDPGVEMAEVNPFTVDEPNLLGVPLLGRATAIIEAGDRATDYMDVIKQALFAGTGFPYGGIALQIVLVDGDQPVFYPDEPTPLIEWNRPGFERFLDQIQVGATLSPEDYERAVTIAVGASPRQLIFITSGKLDRSDAEALTSVVQRAPGVRCDALTIGGGSTGLGTLVRSRGGREQALPPQRLWDWYTQAMAPAENDDIAPLASEPAGVVSAGIEDDVNH